MRRVWFLLCEKQRRNWTTEGEAVLDFSSIRRIDTSGVRALEDLVRLADAKSVKVVLRGVNVDVYKVLKLMKLTRRFSL